MFPPRSVPACVPSEPDGPGLSRSAAQPRKRASGRAHRPDHEPGSPDPMHNELGLRNVTFEVDDLQAILGRLAADGYHLVGGVGQYEGSWRMASVRGPEGLIVNLAQRIN